MEYFGWKGLRKDEDGKGVEKNEQRRFQTSGHLKNPNVS